MMTYFAIVGTIALIVLISTFIFAVYIDRRHMSDLKRLKQELLEGKDL